MRSPERAWLLLPRLEETHASHQTIAAEPVIYFEFPGVEPPLRRAGAGVAQADRRRSVAHGCGIAFGRVAQIQNAFPNATVKPSSIVQQMRLRKYTRR